MNFPYGITMKDATTLLITESDNHSLRQITLTPIPSPQIQPQPTQPSL